MYVQFIMYWNRNKDVNNNNRNWCRYIISFYDFTFWITIVPLISQSVEIHDGFLLQKRTPQSSIVKIQIVNKYPPYRTLCKVVGCKLDRLRSPTHFDTEWNMLRPGTVTQRAQTADKKEHKGALATWVVLCKIRRVMNLNIWSVF